jgi:hypothetical protein
MLKRLFRVAALTAGLATVLAAGSMALLATPAQADDATALARAKAEVTRRIDLRLAALHRFDGALTAAAHLTDAHEATLKDLVADDLAGLTALKTKVAGETTLAALRVDAVSMVNDYRVFILVGPKVRLTIAADHEADAATRLQTAHDKLADAVAQAKAAGKDVAAAEQDLADMQAAIDRAKNGMAGQVDTLLAIQPGPDGNAIRAKVGAVRRALGQVRLDLRTALAEGKAVRDFLRHL